MPVTVVCMVSMMGKVKEYKLLTRSQKGLSMHHKMPIMTNKIAQNINLLLKRNNRSSIMAIR